MESNNQELRNQSPSPLRAAIVEDDTFVAEMLVIALARLDVEAVHYSRISNARQPLLDGRFDFAIIDVGLPDGNGLDFIQELRASATCKRLPVIVATSNYDDELVKHAYGDCDATLVSHKPISWACLSYVVQSMNAELKSTNRTKAAKERKAALV